MESSFTASVDLVKKEHGKDAICRLDEKPEKYSGISTGSIGLDLAIGGFGLPRGRIVEVFGPEASGKTTIALKTIASAQKMGLNCVIIDAEHALDPYWAKINGVDVNALWVSQPTCGEEGLQIAELMVKSNECGVVVIDSIAALAPKAELDGEMGDKHVGLQARMMSQAMRKLSGIVSKTGTLLLMTNQVREKIGVQFGSPITTPGGRAAKFYSSVRLDVRRIGQEKTGDEVIGSKTLVNVVKNKVAPPFRRAEFVIYSKCGIDASRELTTIAIQKKIIKRAGAWYSYGETRIGQGFERASEFIKENQDVSSQILKEVLGENGQE